VIQCGLPNSIEQLWRFCNACLGDFERYQDITTIEGSLALLEQCAKSTKDPLFAAGDVFNFLQWASH
jgi:hypothetical protein